MNPIKMARSLMCGAAFATPIVAMAIEGAPTKPQTARAASARAHESAATFGSGVTLAHWTSFLFEGRTYGDPQWFAEGDVAWIAAQGLDHVQILVGGDQVTDAQGLLDSQRMLVLDRAIGWCERAGLGVVLSVQRFPPFEPDAKLPEAEREQAMLDHRARFWGALARHFAPHGDHVRFATSTDPDRIAKDITQLNAYNRRALDAIRAASPRRVVYLSAFDGPKLAGLWVPTSDRHFAIETTVPAETALDVFAEQHGLPKPIPLVSFPGTIPDLRPILGDKHWASAHSGARVDATLVEQELSRIAAWRDAAAPGIEVRLAFWRYFTGWPLKPAALQDRASIENYGRALARAGRQHRIGWTIYDYNSGGRIRVNGEPLPMLRGLLDG